MDVEISLAWREKELEMKSTTTILKGRANYRKNGRGVEKGVEDLWRGSKAKDRKAEDTLKKR